MKFSLTFLAILSTGFELSSCQNDYRLPETVIPSKYEVDIKVPEEVFSGLDNKFEGVVTIHFTVSARTSEIKLHHRVTPLETSLIASPNIIISIVKEDYNTTTDIYTLTFSGELSVDTIYSLNIKYNGILNKDSMTGFYISTYPDQDNDTAYLVTTQFSPTDARHAFPCFDEPQYKATFTISLTHPTNLTALSNSKVESRKPGIGSGTTITTFEETTKMSTYLVAFIISAFTCTEGDTIESGVPHRVCSRPEEAAHRKWASDIGTPLIRTLENITGIKYSTYMPKMDQVAIPDFFFDAMENWGLVTHREIGLLYSEEDTSNGYKKNIVLDMAHEISHMWFGNLVTMKWWDYTFLKEAFARFYEYFAAAKQFLDWQLEKHFNVEQLHTALLDDSFSGAQALTSPSASPIEVSNKFSIISYNKGAAIYRMIETNIMGADNFIKGIREYLSLNQLSSTVPANLWSALAAFVPNNALPAEVDLPTALNNWIEMSGYPVVMATRSGDNIILTQQRFLLSGNDTRQYYVPITYTLSSDTTKFSNTTVKTWLTPDKYLTLSGVMNGNSWIILNNRQSGFYRVDYDSSLWSALKSQLQTNHLAIDVLNRAQIVSDMYNFARAHHNGGYGNWTFSDVMDLLSYLENEVDYYPWYAAFVGNNHLLHIIGYDSEEGKQFTAWMLNLMEKVQITVPFELLDSSNQVYTMKQVLILSSLCKYGEPKCIAKSKTLFEDYKVNGNKVPKNLRDLVYCNGLKYSESPDTDFKFLWQKYSETKLMSESITIMSGLGCVEDNSLLKWYLGQTLNATSSIRVQDFTTVWSYVYSNGKIGTNAALEFIAANYHQLVQKNKDVEDLIFSIADYIYDETQLEKLQLLGNIHGLSENHKIVVQTALENANYTIHWAELPKTDIRTFFANQNRL